MCLPEIVTLRSCEERMGTQKGMKVTCLWLYPHVISSLHSARYPTSFSLHMHVYFPQACPMNDATSICLVRE